MRPSARHPNGQHLKSLLKLQSFLFLCLCLGLCLPGFKPAQADSSEFLDRSVLRQAWTFVRDQFFDRNMRGLDWNAVLRTYEKKVKYAKSQRDVHSLIQQMLGELKVSHLSLIEADIYKQHVLAEFENRMVPCYGLELVGLTNGIFVANVLDGSTAEQQGVRRGDRIISLDGVVPENSTLLRPSGSDPGLDSPGGFYLKVVDQIKIEFERIPDIGPRGVYTLTLTPKKWNAVCASKQSIAVKERFGLKMGYMHLWHLASMDVVIDLERALQTTFLECQGIVLDLRGRGGTPENVKRVLTSFEKHSPYGIRWSKSIVAIIDSGTRSAKEVLAFHLRRKNIATLLGERTQGAVLGGKFQRLKDGAWLIVPTVDMRAMSMGVNLEAEGVEPHLKVKDKLQFANGEDKLKTAAFDELFWQLRRQRRKSKRRGYF